MDPFLEDAMTDVWEEREKAFENEWVYKREKVQMSKMKEDAEREKIQATCFNRCPKCGELIEAMVFRGVPLDKCPSCGGVWICSEGFRILSTKDHRNWFEKWMESEGE